jgi:hypothetical protein
MNKLEIGGLKRSFCHFFNFLLVWHVFTLIHSYVLSLGTGFIVEALRICETDIVTVILGLHTTILPVMSTDTYNFIDEVDLFDGFDGPVRRSNEEITVAPIVPPDSPPSAAVPRRVRFDAPILVRVPLASNETHEPHSNARPARSILRNTIEEGRQFVLPPIEDRNDNSNDSMRSLSNSSHVDGLPSNMKLVKPADLFDGYVARDSSKLDRRTKKRKNEAEIRQKFEDAQLTETPTQRFKKSRQRDAGLVIVKPHTISAFVKSLEFDAGCDCWWSLYKKGRRYKVTLRDFDTNTDTSLNSVPAQMLSAFLSDFFPDTRLDEITETPQTFSIIRSFLFTKCPVRERHNDDDDEEKGKWICCNPAHLNFMDPALRSYLHGRPIPSNLVGQDIDNTRAMIMWLNRRPQAKCPTTRLSWTTDNLVFLFGAELVDLLDLTDKRPLLEADGKPITMSLTEFIFNYRSTFEKLYTGAINKETRSGTRIFEKKLRAVLYPGYGVVDGKYTVAELDRLLKTTQQKLRRLIKAALQEQKQDESGDVHNEDGHENEDDDDTVSIASTTSLDASDFDIEEEETASIFELLDETIQAKKGAHIPKYIVKDKTPTPKPLRSRSHSKKKRKQTPNKSPDRRLPTKKKLLPSNPSKRHKPETISAPVAEIDDLVSDPESDVVVSR